MDTVPKLDPQEFRDDVLRVARSRQPGRAGAATGGREVDLGWLALGMLLGGWSL